MCTDGIQQQLTQRQVIVQRDEKGYGFKVTGDNPVFINSVAQSKAAAFVSQCWLCSLAGIAMRMSISLSVCPSPKYKYAMHRMIPSCLSSFMPSSML